jgi:hypothetical protein
MEFCFFVHILFRLADLCLYANAMLTSSPTLAFGHRLRGKEGDSYGATHELPLA